MTGKLISTKSLAAIGLAVGMVAMPQLAASQNDGMPAGSWRQTCQGASVRNGTLSAVCLRDGGKKSEISSVAIGNCRAFGNRNGQLFCESPGYDNGNVGQWSGSFRESCRDESVDKHGKLQATCRKANGTFKRSNLQAQKCPSYRAGNRDGELVCEPNGNTASASGAGRWGGSFSQSCRDVSTDANGSLTATCQTANGRWNRTSLSPAQCSGRVAGNRDGNLFCESNGNPASANGAGRWGGSFSKSCRDVSTDASGSLTATCQSATGRWNRTSLSPAQCSGRKAGNRDGTLFCESEGSLGGAGRWEGSFSQSCRDFATDQNGVLTATCQTATGRWNRTSLSPAHCSGRKAGNRDGTLFCESEGSLGGAGRWEGSFSQSCRDLATDSNGVLTATCQTETGRWNRTSLSPAQCSGRKAGNRDGTLICESEGSHGGAGRWEGSFSQTCRDLATDSNGLLMATCQTATGRWNRSSLSPAQCSGRRAGNRDGTLFCESNGSTGGTRQWGGSFSQSCRDVTTDSNGVLTATCQTANGRWNRTSLSPAQCSGRNAGNRDGSLFCESSGDNRGYNRGDDRDDGDDDGPGRSFGQWGGSFSQSCRDLSTDSNGVLTATCQTANGRWNRTNLSPAQCMSRNAGNRDGVLFCER